MIYKNVIIYLIGFAGVGKLTTARKISEKVDFKIIDNQTINNVVFPFVRVDSKTKLPSEIWGKVDKIRDIALETMVEIGNRDFNFIFTNQLMQNDNHDYFLYKQIEDAAHEINACFLPVRLLCDKDEHRRRIAQPEREAYLKLISPGYVDAISKKDLFNPEHPNTLTLDTTNFTVEQSAAEILNKLSRII